MPGGEEQRRLEHGVGRRHAGECAGDLRRDVEWHFAPRDAALRSVGERHGGIEVRARDGAERQDQGHERRTRRQGVREKSDGDVASRQPFGHDPGAHDSCQQHGSPDTLGGQALRQPELLFCDGHAGLPFSVYNPAGSPVETIWEVPREQVSAVRGPVARRRYRRGATRRVSARAGPDRDPTGGVAQRTVKRGEGGARYPPPPPAPAYFPTRAPTTESSRSGRDRAGTSGGSGSDRSRAARPGAARSARSGCDTGRRRTEARKLGHSKRPDRDPGGSAGGTAGPEGRTARTASRDHRPSATAILLARAIVARAESFPGRPRRASAGSPSAPRRRGTAAGSRTAAADSRTATAGSRMATADSPSATAGSRAGAAAGARGPRDGPDSARPSPGRCGRSRTAAF